ncbi:unnamed protein product [Linum trigynum]|uniref:RNase H type-1 domain-containing protein n=1 Tax=Linum trigynum TaxID=586398 RepID=A0AAV2H0G2_9ROSI
MAESSIVNYVTSKAADWLKTWDSASSSLSVVERPPRTDQLIGWKAPPSGWRKMNTDGAAQGNQGLATAGGLLRDSNGDWVCGFCCKIGTGTAILAELWGIHQGLLMAWNNGTQFLILETDSQLAIELIKAREDPVHPHSTLLAGI